MEWIHRHRQPHETFEVGEGAWEPRERQPFVLEPEWKMRGG